MEHNVLLEGYFYVLGGSEQELQDGCLSTRHHAHKLNCMCVFSGDRMIGMVWRVLVLQGMLLLAMSPSGQTVPARFQSIEEWKLWKEDHSKQYNNNMVCNQQTV